MRPARSTALTQSARKSDASPSTESAPIAAAAEADQVDDVDAEALASTSTIWLTPVEEPDRPWTSTTGSPPPTTW